MKKSLIKVFIILVVCCLTLFNIPHTHAATVTSGTALVNFRKVTANTLAAGRKFPITRTQLTQSDLVVTVNISGKAYTVSDYKIDEAYVDFVNGDDEIQISFGGVSAKTKVAIITNASVTSLTSTV